MLDHLNYIPGARYGQCWYAIMANLDSLNKNGNCCWCFLITEITKITLYPVWSFIHRRKHCTCYNLGQTWSRIDKNKKKLCVWLCNKQRCCTFTWGYKLQTNRSQMGIWNHKIKSLPFLDVHRPLMWHWENILTQENREFNSFPIVTLHSPVNLWKYIAKPQTNWKRIKLSVFLCQNVLPMPHQRSMNI
jgi:hypothetical protein